MMLSKLINSNNNIYLYRILLIKKIFFIFIFVINYSILNLLMMFYDNIQ